MTLKQLVVVEMVVAFSRVVSYMKGQVWNPQAPSDEDPAKIVIGGGCLAADGPKGTLVSIAGRELG